MTVAEKPRPSLRSELEAVQELRASYAAIMADDPDAAADIIEGETSLFDVFDRMIAHNVTDKAMAEACDRAIADMEARRKRFTDRIDRRRVLIEQAMLIADVSKVERPLATLSLTTRQPSIIVLDEAAIPADFWKAGEPKLDKALLKKALSDGAAIPGAALSNAAPSLTIRSK